MKKNTLSHYFILLVVLFSTLPILAQDPDDVEDNNVPIDNWIPIVMFIVLLFAYRFFLNKKGQLNNLNK